MKLIELLEQGNKATRKGLEIDYILTDDINGTFGFVNNEVCEMYNIGLSDMTRDDWYEYKEELVNINPSINDEVYYIQDTGLSRNIMFKNDIIDNSLLTNFNLFDSEEFAKYISKKQLLERKLMIYSYLNGANEIDWDDQNDKKYFIETDFIIKNNNAYIDYAYEYKKIGSVYFVNEETASKCLDLYTSEIDEVMNLSLKFKM